MSVGRAAVLLLLSVAGVTSMRAQEADVEAFAGGAVMLGAQGFARPPITSAVGATYVHVPVHPALLLGAQGGMTFRESERSHAAYAVGTIAYAQRRGRLWQVYPFVGAGAASFRTRPGGAPWKPAFAAGFGVDIMLRDGAPASMLGARVGYLTRSMGDDESVAYAAVGIGLGGRRRERHEPRSIVAR